MSDDRLDPDTPIPGVAGGRTVGDFWAWAFSNILTNNLRGIFAEYLVGTALGAVMCDGPVASLACHPSTKCRTYSACSEVSTARALRTLRTMPMASSAVRPRVTRFPPNSRLSHR